MGRGIHTHHYLDVTSLFPLVHNINNQFANKQQTIRIQSVIVNSQQSAVMFLKGFLVLSCLVLYTTSVPVKTCQRGPEMNATLDKIKHRDSYLPMVNFADKINETYQDTFCQVSKALNMSDCNDSNMTTLQNLSRQMQGNVTSCTLQDVSNLIHLDKFLKNLQQYLQSLNYYCYTRIETGK
ncbi:uncharacterized protein LOC143832447 [Paroedura picta]|uniref:uncharacterized protein LOC143832447 n=1 Tax=Paroedura picta TaxID=143630 RepID=UPI004056C798